MGMCIYLGVEHIDQPKQKHMSCSCEQKLIGPGMTQARLDLNYVSLEHVYLTTVSSVGAVWVVNAYIYENSTHWSETKITDKCFKILFLIFLHYIPHEKCINHGIKCRGHDK